MKGDVTQQTQIWQEQQRIKALQSEIDCLRRRLEAARAENRALTLARDAALRVATWGSRQRAAIDNINLTRS